MDGKTTAALACVIAGSLWIAGGFVVFASRLRARRERRRLGEPPPTTQRVPAALEPVALAETENPDARGILLLALRSGEPEVRRAAVTALGRLAHRHDWAIDGLIEALAERRDTPARVAAQLDRIAPAADTRLTPLLGHPNGAVRYYASRLLARAVDAAQTPPGADLTRDPSPHVRAAGLEALGQAQTGTALRRALQLLEDPHPAVRAHACLAASAISPRSAAALVAPLLADESWEVRNAAREALVRAGEHATAAAVPLLEHENETVRGLAALILQDTGLVDELLRSGDDARLLERIFAAGGERLRALAEDRVRRPLTRPAVVAEAAG